MASHRGVFGTRSGNGKKVTRYGISQRSVLSLTRQWEGRYEVWHLIEKCLERDQVVTRRDECRRDTGGA